MILVARRIIERMRSATSVMSEKYSTAVRSFHRLPRKKVSVGFDGGQLSSDAGVLGAARRREELGLAARLASCIRDRRNPERIVHPLEEMLRLRMFGDRGGLRGQPTIAIRSGTIRSSRWR